MKAVLVLLVLCAVAIALAAPQQGHGGGAASAGKKKQQQFVMPKKMPVKKVMPVKKQPVIKKPVKKPPPPPKFTYQYAAPFVCGSSDGSDAQLINGDYATTIMIHNPEEKGTAAFRKKVAVSSPAGNKNAGAVSRFIADSLDADGATEIDCDEIMGGENYNSAFFGQNSPFGRRGKDGQNFAQGYVVIESDVSLDVDRVTTAGNVEDTQFAEWPQEKKGGRAQAQSSKKREPRQQVSSATAAGAGKKAPPKKVQVKKPPPKITKVQKVHKAPQLTKVQQIVNTEVAPRPTMRTVSQQNVASINVDRIRERAFKK